MNKITKSLVLICILISRPLFAFEFTYFKLNNSKTTNSGLPSIYESIINEIGDSTDEIGNLETGALLLNSNLGGDVTNFSSFTWNKPMANFKIYAKRDVKPSFMDDKWIVHDQLTLDIDAKTFLSNLEAGGSIEFDEGTIAAFAGLSFTRTYHYYHYANSFAEGLQSDYRKLFLSFKYFTPENILNLSNDDFLKKEDAFSFSIGAGANIRIPSTPFSLRAAGLLQHTSKKEQTFQSINEKESNDFLRISIEKSYRTVANIDVAAQVDFFNLLKITLFSHELNYEIEMSNKLNLSFNKGHKQQISQSNDANIEYKNIIRGKQLFPKILENAIVSQEYRKEQNLSSKTSFLIFGSMRKSGTEQFKIIKDNQESIYYKHTASSNKITENFWSRLFSSAIHKIFKFKTGVKNFSQSLKSYSIEYRKDKNLNSNYANTNEDISITLSHSFYAAKTVKSNKKKYKKLALSNVKNFSNLNHNLLGLIQNNTIRGPLTFESNFQINKAGIEYFINLPSNDVYEQISYMCIKNENKIPNNRGKISVKLKQDQKRRISMCNYTLKKAFNSYSKILNKDNLIALTSLKSFITKYFKKVDNRSQLNILFGSNNIFMHGSIKAKTNQGSQFTDYFKSGEFTGLGVIASNT